VGPHAGAAGDAGVQIAALHKTMSIITLTFWVHPNREVGESTVKKTWMGAGLVVAAMWGNSPVQAQDTAPEMRPYVSGMFSYVFDEDERGELVGGGPDAFNEGKGLQLSVGKAINQWLGVEIAAFGHNFSSGGGGNGSLRDYGGKLDGLFFYSRDSRFSPYFGLGVGSIETDRKNLDSSSTDPFADVGLGFIKYFEVAGNELGFRGDLRYRHIFVGDDAFGGQDQDDLGEAVLKFGVVIPLGPKPTADAATKPAACIDSDADGVCDTADLCPETPKGTVVDAKGCPVEKKAAVGDPNHKFEDVHFAFDKSDLTDYAKSLLDNAAKVINDLSKNYPQLKVDVAGHTDSIGTDGYNQSLSERRAVVVKQYLQRKGVDAGRISTQAYGEARPKATNDSEEGRALNRRSEVRTREK
jgi:OmpA-OmpF porin, OOP family